MRGDSSGFGLGDGMTSSSTTPVLVAGISDATAVLDGGEMACALRSDGAVACWGANAFGSLGDGSLTGPDTCPGGYACSLTPVAVQW
jgi:alpha-tubulin suppressor-like RCC1 family protein